MDLLSDTTIHLKLHKDVEGRNHQLTNRLSSTEMPPLVNIDKTPGPTLSLSELSPIEQEIYNEWWDELDPFGLGIVVNEAMHPFLLASGLVEEALEQIIGFYIGESKYTEDQFYAIIRLVAHGQSGRKINRDLVVLGAPLANFDQDTVDSLFSQSNNQSISKPTTDKGAIRNTWWGQELSQKDTLGTALFLTRRQQNHRSHQQQKQKELDTPAVTSYRHSFTGSHIPALYNDVQSSHAFFNTTTRLPMQPKPFDWAEKALSSSIKQTTTISQQSTLNALRTIETSGDTTTRTAKNSNVHSHSRSPSVPYASEDAPPADMFQCDTISAAQSKYDRPRLTLAYRSSTDTTTDTYKQHQQHPSVDHGQSLLLTQRFTPPSSTTKSTNPFEQDDTDNDSDYSDKPARDKATIVEQTITSNDSSADNKNEESLLTNNTANDMDEKLSLLTAKTTSNDSTPASGSMMSVKMKPTLIDVDILPYELSSPTSSGRNNIPSPTTSPQFTKPDLVLFNRPQLPERNASQHDGQKHSFLSQGAFLLATSSSSSSSSSSVQFPTPPLPTIPLDDTNRLVRHRSITSFPK